jgi:hypothetical protein
MARPLNVVWLGRLRKRKSHRAGDRASTTASQRSALRKSWLPVQPRAADVDAAPADEDDAADKLPVRSAMEACIEAPVRGQYSLTSRVCMRLLVEELQIHDVYAGIRCVLLGSGGGVLQTVLDGMEAARAACPHPPAARLQDALDEALARTPLARSARSCLSCRCVTAI